MTVYEYRTIRVARASWPKVSDGVFGPVDEATRNVGGSLFALFSGLIGFASDEGVLMRAWPDDEALSGQGDRTLATGDVALEATVEQLVTTVRPVDVTPPDAEGVYAHRWFWLREADWREFERLSEEGVWPFFESDGCRIIGLWRSTDPGPACQSLLITRYRNVAHWERTRLQSVDPPSGADGALYRRARQAALRRAELTERSIVRLTRLILPPR